MRRSAQASLHRAVVVIVLLMLMAAPALANSGTHADPYARGTLANSIDGFAIRVLAVNTDAWPVIRSAGASNRRPFLGSTDVLVRIEAINRGRDAGIPFVSGTLNAVGRAGTPYTPFARGCGVIPRDVSTISPISPGKSAVVNVCWQVDDSDVDSLLMVYEPYQGARNVYFALHRAAP